MSVAHEANILNSFSIYDSNGESLKIDVHEKYAAIGSLAIQLPPDSRDMLLSLASPLSVPRLALHISEMNPSLGKNTRISDVYKDLVSRFENTTINENFISIGRGKSTWYGLLDSPDDMARQAFALEGHRIVTESTRAGKQKQKRLLPFDAILDMTGLGEGTTESTWNADGKTEDVSHTKRNMVIASSAGAMTLGALTYYFWRKVRH